MAKDFELIGITRPEQLVDQDPLRLYERLCAACGGRQDPWVLDTFISVTRFMSGNDPQPWWAYTEERKQLYGPVLNNGRHDATRE